MTGVQTCALPICLWIALLIVGMLAMVVLIVHVNEAERRIPVQYAKRQVGRKMYGGQACMASPYCLKYSRIRSDISVPISRTIGQPT